MIQIFMIAIESTSKSYKGKQVVNELSLSVAAGEIYGLLGSNGAGKSTTLNMLLGFLKPDSGATLINGIDTTTDAERARKQTGYIPENVSLYPYLTGLENLDYFCKLAGIAYNKAELSDILSICGLQADAHNKKTETYSKGMRQKVGIAIAYAKKAKVYLLDEPASGLDPLASNELSALLKRLADEGAAVLMASHDIFRVRETCNRIGILKHGVLVKEMNTSEVTANELEKIYLDYMQD
ncbi:MULTISPECIES: ABC transporter ATP-binding protein [unclassified Sphingobacterium]|uniref:ABC transporter ATP-binding protein n=1 Tax=unclassified Sphingobacterium TaxID=2609468 RepID=UPI0025F92E90|nr:MULTISPECIES: ABC transporter ATP-binding protein [unclassified Sphingobacterium]